MSFDWYDAERSRYDGEEGIEEFLRESLKDISRENARTYLGTYGDAIDARVEACLQKAENLLALGHEGPSLCLTATSIELMIGFLLLRPLIQGAFLSDQWADVLTKQIVGGRSANDRALLPAVLRMWGIDIDTLKTHSGISIWKYVLKQLQPSRDNAIHRGDIPPPNTAATAIECARYFRKEVVGTVASNLGFTLETTGKWHEIRGNQGTHTWSQNFEPRDPFAQ